MEAELQKNLAYVNQTLSRAELYDHAVRVLSYDQETICPPKAMEEQGNVMAFLQNQSFQLHKDPKFIAAAEYLYAHRNDGGSSAGSSYAAGSPDQTTGGSGYHSGENDRGDNPGRDHAPSENLAGMEEQEECGLGEFDRVLAETLHREYLRTKNITPAMQHDFDLAFNKAFVDWLQAKQAADFSLFAPSLSKVRQITLQQISLREDALPDRYDNLLDEYERGMTVKILDRTFERCKERLILLLDRIMKSPKKIRTDFLSRKVTDEQQRQMTDYLLDVIGFDKTRGAWTLTEHPFTDGLWVDDNRITTHFYPDSFTSSMFTVIHEGGHALFEMLQPRENYAHHIFMNKSMAMHESVSRFYENRIGRSRAFVHLIYPKTCEIFPQVMSDVSEEEFYEALNVVRPSLIRTEADEFTYTFHIIIRYELEKQIVDGDVRIEDLPHMWNEKYKEYLGITPSNDREGILQDVHWASGFGYFFSYAVGNMYNAMYYNRMQQDFDIDAAVAAGDFDRINTWMAQHVFAKADRQDSQTWIHEITGRAFTPDDFLDYLEEKYTALYELK